MKIRKIINRRLGRNRDGVNVAGAVNAVVSADVNEPAGKRSARVTSRQRIVQRDGRTVVSESHVRTEPREEDRDDG